MAFATDAGLLDDDVRAAGDAAMASLERAMAGEDYLAVRHGIEALDLATKPFAQRRMNRAVDAAMRGRRLTDVEQSFSEH